GARRSPGPRRGGGTRCAGRSWARRRAAARARRSGPGPRPRTPLQPTVWARAGPGRRGGPSSWRARPRGGRRAPARRRARRRPRRAGVSPRVLRYYEQQGLLLPRRAGNDYREYTEEDAARAQRVALMVRSGMPTRLIKAVLDLEDTLARDPDASCPL